MIGKHQNNNHLAVSIVYSKYDFNLLTALIEQGRVNKDSTATNSQPGDFLQQLCQDQQYIPNNVK